MGAGLADGLWEVRVEGVESWGGMRADREGMKGLVWTGSGRDMRE